MMLCREDGVGLWTWWPSPAVLVLPHPSCFLPPRIISWLLRRLGTVSPAQGVSPSVLGRQVPPFASSTFEVSLFKSPPQKLLQVSPVLKAPCSLWCLGQGVLLQVSRPGSLVPGLLCGTWTRSSHLPLWLLSLFI